MAANDTREERLAAALRKNLRHRKAQARALSEQLKTDADPLKTDKAPPLERD